MTPRRELAVLVVSYRRADLLDRALASVEKYLPQCRVHVWDNRSSGSADVAALAERRPDVRWTFSESNLGYIAAMNRLAAQVPDCDMLHLNPDAELLGPLTAARAALAEPGVAAVSPTVEDPEGREERWDVAHRDQGVVRNLLNSAGYAKRKVVHAARTMAPANVARGAASGVNRTRRRVVDAVREGRLAAQTRERELRAERDGRLVRLGEHLRPGDELLVDGEPVESGRIILLRRPERAE